MANRCYNTVPQMQDPKPLLTSRVSTKSLRANPTHTQASAATTSLSYEICGDLLFDPDARLLVS